MSTKIVNSAGHTAPRAVTQGILGATVFAMGMAAACVSGATAAPQDRDSANSDIVISKLVYVDDTSLFRVRLTESALLKAGCTYLSEDQEKNHKLRDILRTFPLQRESIGKAMVEPRYALYLTRKSGARETILLDRAYTGASRVYGTLEGAPISVELGLASAIVQWAFDEKLQQVNDQCVARKSP